MEIIPSRIGNLPDWNQRNPSIHPSIHSSFFFVENVANLLRVVGGKVKCRRVATAITITTAAILFGLVVVIHVVCDDQLDRAPVVGNIEAFPPPEQIVVRIGSVVYAPASPLLAEEWCGFLDCSCTVLDSFRGEDGTIAEGKSVVCDRDVVLPQKWHKREDEDQDGPEEWFVFFGIQNNHGVLGGGRCNAACDGRDAHAGIVLSYRIVLYRIIDGC